MDFDLPAPVRAALSRLREAGYAAYVVGGCVRDWALGIPPHDYDLCTAAAPEEMQRVFQGERTVETGLRHGTLTVLLSGMPLEITTFRQDGEYLDGRHPASVRFTRRVEEDLARRDFTINAMAYCPEEGVIDPFGGREDCKRGVIRCVGDARTRFSEDALRILRALRFSARLGFPIEEATARALLALCPALQKISRERVAAEMTGLLLGEHAEKVLSDNAPVIFAALPALGPGASQKAEKSPFGVVGLVPREEALRWAALLLPLSERAAERALRDLKMPNRLIDAVSELLRWRDTLPTPETLQYLLMRMGPKRLSQLLLLQRARQTASARDGADAPPVDFDALTEKLERLLRENACYTLAALAVNGRDLAALGARGAQIGQMLNDLLARVARGQAPNEREALLRLAREEGPVP